MYVFDRKRSGAMECTGRGLSLKEELTCAICCDLFTEPVMLDCMHHFCKACISTYWKGIRGRVSCPQCRQEFSSRQLHTNYLVAGMVEKVRACSSESNHKELQQLKESLLSHLSRKENYMSMIQRCKKKVDAVKAAGNELEGWLQGEFQVLHQMLYEEQAAMLEQLRREEKEMLGALSQHLGALMGAVTEVEQNVRVLQQTMDTMEHSLLLETPKVNLRSSVEVGKVPEIDLKAFAGKYKAPLQYMIWRKIFKLLKPAPAPVTFDVETAHPSLYVSRDHLSVVESEKMLPYKRSPKRFVQCVNVLGAQSFQSGRHYWEVEVGNKTKWDLGVALDSVDRQVRAKLCPENGYWTIRLRNGNEYSAGTQPWTRLVVASFPRCIGVLLNFEEQRVSFYNADNMQLLFSFSNGPWGKALPFFSTCLSEPGQRAQPIRLVHFPLGPL
ncbi:tripartite motif containing 105 isoform X2 [Scleropages formosus]|uniref:tripartite motif containing 105 isoform X2 n=1 Tax=Scleropages formosus TaxID=113540 RepID=UPI0008785D86|nr:zinc-binding protein A33-like isoform X2 [Scleropages formosus]